MITGLDQTGPFAHTPLSLESTLLSQILGNTALAPFVPTITNTINASLGLSNDVFMNSVLFSNMSPTGVYNSQVQRGIEAAATRTINAQRARATQSWLADIGRTTMSYDSWRKQQGIKDDTAATKQWYADYIQNEAYGRSENFAWGMAYNFLDPQGLNAASTYLGKTAANIARHGAARGRRGAMLQARAMGRLFEDSDTFKFDKTDFGGMNIGEASAVAAAITKDIDIFEGSGAKPEDIERASKRLQQMTKDYTKALSPLKDVFGSDIPEMIATLEQIAGKSLTSMSPEAVARMASRAMAGVAGGVYTMGQLSGGTTMMQRSLAAMDISPMYHIGAFSMAEGALGVANGYKPAYMSDAAYADWAGQFVLSSAASAGSDAFNQAYAVWKRNNQGGSIDAFRAQYDQLRKNMTADAALLQLSGTSSLYELRREGLGSEAYAEAVRGNYGGMLAMTENVNDMIAAGRQMSDNQDAYDAAVRAIRENTRLLTDPQALNDSNLPEDVKAEIRRIASNYYDDSASGISVHNALLAEGNQRRNQRIIDRQMKMRESIDALKLNFSTGVKDLIGNIIANPDMDLGALATQSQWLALADEDTREAMITDLQIAKRMAIARGITDEESLKKVYEDSLSYSINNAEANGFRVGLQERYKELKGDYGKAGEAGQREARYAALIDLSRFMSGDLLAEYTNDAQDEEAVRRVVDYWNELDTENITDAATRGREVSDRLTAEAYGKKLDSRSFENAKYAERLKAAVEKQAKNREKGLEVSDWAAIEKEAARGLRVSEADKLAAKNAYRETLMGAQNTDVLLQDNLGAQHEVLSKLSQLLDAMGATETAELNKDSGGMLGGLGAFWDALADKIRNWSN